MRLLKSKAFIGAVCLALAAVTAFVLLPRAFAKEKATVTVPRAKREIRAGTGITADMLVYTETGSYGLPEGLARDASDIIGKTATETVHEGEYFWTDQLADGYDEENKGGLERGQCLVTLKLPSASAGLAGVLRPGCTVDVFSCGADEENGGYAARKIYENMYVHDVLNSRFLSLADVDAQAEEKSANLNYEPCYAVVRCTEYQAMRLMCLEREGTLHLTLRKEG